MPSKTMNKDDSRVICASRGSAGIAKDMETRGSLHIPGNQTGEERHKLAGKLTPLPYVL